MSVYKKKNRWYADYYLNGRRIREVVSIQGVDPSKITLRGAQQAFAIRKAEIAQGKFKIANVKKSISFEVLCTEYLENYSKVNKRSWRRDLSSIKHFLDYFGDKKLNQITSWLIEKYKAERKKLVKKSTVNRELDTFRHIFNKAVDWGYIDKSPYTGVKKFKVNNTNLRILSDAEFKDLYNASSASLKPILQMAVHTGMRLGEILSLLWDDVNLKEGHLLVRDSKNYESRYIPLHPELTSVLIDLKNRSDSEYVFGGRTTIKRQWANALKKSGIKHCRFHDLRHTFGSNLGMSGVDIVTVAELMGHKDLSITKRYSHPTPEHKKSAINRLSFIKVDTYMDTSVDIRDKTS